MQRAGFNGYFYQITRNKAEQRRAAVENGVQSEEKALQRIKGQQ